MRAKARVPLLTQAIPTLDIRRIAPDPKRADPVYQTPEYRLWRDQVITRAGGRCEAITNGKRCWKGTSHGHRMFADHILELRDGGSLLDPSNGMCLCGAHHSAKTAQARAARHI